MSLEQFLQLPEEEPALEYWDGEVTQKPWPNGPHSALQCGAGEQIGRLAGPGRPFRVFPGVRVTFAGASTVPSLVAFRRERVPRDPTAMSPRISRRRPTSPSRASRPGSRGPSYWRAAVGT